MMIDPPIAELVKKAGSRYMLTIETAKRARQLADGKRFQSPPRRFTRISSTISTLPTSAL